MTNGTQDMLIRNVNPMNSALEWAATLRLWKQRQSCIQSMDFCLRNTILTLRQMLETSLRKIKEQEARYVCGPVCP